MKIARSKVHFIGIGGIGMCGLAEVLHKMGAEVSGSDLVESRQVELLRRQGLQVAMGHDPHQVKGADVVVYSSAVRKDNPELREALRLKIPCIHRAEALAELMRLKRGIAVAGTHGKTTTTSLISSIFMKAERDPTIVIGGRLAAIQSTALLGHGEWFIAEADESDGSFDRLSPEVAVITNIDNDHLDHYGSQQNLEKAFVNFAKRIPFYGVLIVCGDDPRIRNLFDGFGKKVVTYGLDASHDHVLECMGHEQWRLSGVGDFRCPIPGQHNALNCSAALLVAQYAGIDGSVAISALQEFVGVERRFEFRGQIGGVDFYDDYGHHPTEVRAVLSGFRARFPQRRIVVVFQPHRYSRTALCWNDFLTSFQDCDQLFLLDIYPAGEPPQEGITLNRFIEDVRHPAKKALRPYREGQWQELSDFLKPQDVLVTLGAGDVSSQGRAFMDHYKIHVRESR